MQAWNTVFWPRMVLKSKTVPGGNMNPVLCPECGATVSAYRKPFPTADVIIYDPKLGIVLVRRGHEPLGMALPGGFVEDGESVEHAAVREMKEETGLDVILDGIIGVYSAPGRDPRFHTMTVTFAGHTDHPEQLKAGDDAAAAAFYPLNALPSPLCFDHARAIDDFKQHLGGKRPLLPCAEPF